MGTNNDSKSKEYLIAQDTKRDEDQDSDCIVESDTPTVNRRIGVCNDGIYDVGMRMTDTAGNTGKWVSSEVERDTVNPGRPEVGVDANDEDNYNVYLEIQGEGYATANVTGSSYRQFRLSENGFVKIRVIDLFNYTYSTNYSWNIELRDRAGNVSETVRITFRTKDAPILLPACKAATGQQKLSFPLEVNSGIISGYGTRIHPIKGTPHLHGGVDYSTLGRSMSVLAPADGIVQSYSWDSSGGGNMLVIWHPQLGIRTGYLHLKASLVRPGQIVKAQQKIAISGNTGKYTTGAHLHFSVLKGEFGAWDSTAIDPLSFMYDCSTPDEEDPDGNNQGDGEDFEQIDCKPLDFVGPTRSSLEYCYDISSESGSVEVELNEEALEEIIDWGSLNIPTEIDDFLKQRGMNIRANIVRCAMDEGSPEENQDSWFDKAKQGFSDLVGFVPYAGDAGDLIIAGTGKNYLTGKQASCIERALSGAFGGGGIAADIVGTGAAGIGTIFTSIATEVGQKGLLIVIKNIIKDLGENLASQELKFVIKETLQKALQEGLSKSYRIGEELSFVLRKGSSWYAIDNNNPVVESFALGGGKAIAKVSGKKVAAKIWKDYGLKSIGNFKDEALEHIFEGLSGGARGVGWHHFPSKINSGTSIKPGTKSALNQYGVYTAQVIINGLPKKGKGMSTFFPDHWSKQEVVDSINIAFSTKKTNIAGKPSNYWEGVLPSGMKIGGYLDNGKIATAFPIF